MTLDGAARCAGLALELDWDLAYRRSGYLLLIENRQQWALMAERQAKLHASGIGAQLLDGAEVCRMEPHLAPESVMGALYHPEEGEVDPFQLVQAYVQRGRAHGLEVWTHKAVTQVTLQSARVTGVETQDGSVPARWVILATGAWTRHLGRTAGLDLPVQWVHGEALITERLAPLTENGMSSAAFFEQTEGAGEQVVGFCLNQRPQGQVMIGEAARLTGRLGREVTPTSLPAIAREAQQRFPNLRRVSVLRGWGIPVAFVADNRPLLGPVDELDGLVVATALKSTIVWTPIVGEMVAAMVTGGDVDPRLAEFSPSRVVEES
jgi:glycine/D-amino acid oxidase-like deaminating enzyme